MRPDSIGTDVSVGLLMVSPRRPARVGPRQTHLSFPLIPATGRGQTGGHVSEESVPCLEVAISITMTKIVHCCPDVNHPLPSAPASCQPPFIFHIVSNKMPLVFSPMESTYS